MEVVVATYVFVGSHVGWKENHNVRLDINFLKVYQITRIVFI